MDIIDAHVHTNFEYLPAIEHVKQHGIEFSWDRLQQNMEENRIRAIIAITTDYHLPTPAESELLIEQRSRDARIFPVCAIHPDSTGKKEQDHLEALLLAKQIFGIKIFPGYHPVYPSDERYFPFYSLAAKYDIPVIIHTGDTFGSDKKIKFAHPMPIDEIAVDFRSTRFVIAHLGNPWVRTAAELVYKNENVFTDISAFCIGHMHKPPRYAKDDIRYALEFTNRPDKFIYGSDWPLIGMEEYLSLAKQAVPKEHHQAIFFENANRVFKLGI